MRAVVSLTPLKQLLDSREERLVYQRFGQKVHGAPGGRNNYLKRGSGEGKRKVFKAERKEERESRARRLSGKEFQKVGAAYKKQLIKKSDILF